MPETPTLEDAEAQITAVPVVSLEGLTREDWLQHRRDGIGGSDASAVLGWNRYSSPFKLWLEKTHQLNDDDEESEAAHWGKLLEDPVADETERRTGLSLFKPRWLYQSQEHPFMLGNPDRLGWDPVTDTFGIYEGKTAGFFVRNDWEDGPSAHALIQGNHYLCVLGPQFRWIQISVLVAGQRFETYHIERDEEVIDMLVSAEASFWEKVDHRIEPPATGFDSESDLLKRLWPTAGTDSEMLLPPEAIDLVAERNQLALAIKTSEERKGEIENQIRLWLKDSEIGTTPDGQTLVTYRNVPYTAIDQAVLKEKHPDVYNECRPPGRTTRRFNFPQAKRRKSNAQRI